MTILLFGKNGQVGWELQRSLAPLGGLIALGRENVDLCSAAEIRMVIERERPTVVVNAAAYTAVDRAEAEPAMAYAVNCEAVAVMAKACRDVGACLVHYSTDYVFDGTKPAAYDENDQPAPCNLYGRSKLAGEEAVRDSGCAHLIFRTSWVFARRGANFAATILRLARDREELRVVSDQLGAPTSAELIADATALLLHGRRSVRELESVAGVYHLAAAGETSWYDYARFLLDAAVKKGANLRLQPERLAAIPSSEYPTAAARPLNSRLSTAKLTQRFGLLPPDWRMHVGRFVELERF